MCQCWCPPCALQQFERTLKGRRTVASIGQRTQCGTCAEHLYGRLRSALNHLTVRPGEGSRAIVQMHAVSDAGSWGHLPAWLRGRKCAPTVAGYAQQSRVHSIRTLDARMNRGRQGQPMTYHNSKCKTQIKACSYSGARQAGIWLLLLSLREALATSRPKNGTPFLWPRSRMRMPQATQP